VEGCADWTWEAAELEVEAAGPALRGLEVEGPRGGSRGLRLKVEGCGLELQRYAAGGGGCAGGS
jgi:hypothetical protein